jgi:hypothetical protein
MLLLPLQNERISAMTTYTVHFRTDAESATHDVEADTPDQALAQARQLLADDAGELWFEPYDGMSVNEIAVHDSGGEELALWLDHEMRLRLAASDLLEAAEMVIARWERGDLAEAVRKLDAAVAKAKGGAAADEQCEEAC